jgi:predicted phosphodiesterase
MSEVVVVMTDIHANARALRRALELARHGPMDRLIVLGDLLTYGFDVTEVIDLVGDAQHREGATLLVGNHDQLYFDLAAGITTYYSGLPGWIRESVDHTMAALDASSLTALRWSPEARMGGTLFAHANPFAFGDWTYLNSPQENERAARALAEQDCSVGVFGHTHRRRMFPDEQVSRDHALGDGQAIERVKVTASPSIVNPGAIGQPRGSPGGSSFARLHIGEGLEVEFVDVDYDAASHVATIHASPLSQATRDRLASFFCPTLAPPGTGA